MIKIKKKEFKVLLAKNGMNQNDLSKIVDLSPSTISNVVTGRYSVSTVKAKRICLALNCEIEEVFYFE